MMNRSKRVGALFAKAVAAGALVATAAMLWATPATALPVSGQGTWETTLLGRDVNGNAVSGNNASAVFLYDTALNVTWLRDANNNGQWGAANTWASGLNVGGFTGWRLPTMVDTGAPGCDYSNAGGTDCGYNVQTATSEMAHLYYVTLGNLAYCPPGDANCTGGPQAGFGLSNTGDFQNMQSSGYWSGLEFAPSTSGAWDFHASDGIQSLFDKSGALYALAVRPGDVVAAVPEPESLALVLVGLAAAGVARRRRPL